jgi:hypothetical protein
VTRKRVPGLQSLLAVLRYQAYIPVGHDHFHTLSSYNLRRKGKSVSKVSRHDKWGGGIAPHMLTPALRWLSASHQAVLCREQMSPAPTSRKVASSTPDGVTGIFHRYNPSGRTMPLGLIQPLTEMSTRNNSWGKSGRYVGLTLPPSCADCLESRELQPLVQCNGIVFTHQLSVSVSYRARPDPPAKRNFCLQKE